MDTEQLGIETNEGLLLQLQPLAAELGVNVPSSMEEILEHTDEELKRLDTLLNEAKEQQIDLTRYALDPDTLRYLPVIKRPEKILCVGLNYMQHARELKGDIPTDPVLFSKFNNCLAAHKQEIPIPKVAEEVDYEAELVVVIGKTAKQVTKNNGLDHVLGYTIGNDLSSRALQFKTNQWLTGKTLDYFAPVGPSITTKDCVPDPNQLDISLSRNGKTVQQSNTRELIFSVEYLVSYISQHMTLQPGDLIFTGTPSGVIAGRTGEDQKWLEAEEELTVTIERLGSLTNRLA